MRNGSPRNPNHIVAVTDVSAETLRAVIAQLDVSTDFEHLVYRESELDALWSLSFFLLRIEQEPSKRAAIERLHESALAAHDLVAEGRTREAAGILRSCL